MMKKIVSLVLVFVLCFSVTVLSVQAAEVLPESSHDYENNYFNEWNYTYPQDTKAILVTFSEDTWVEAYSNIIPFIDVKALPTDVSGNIINIFPQKRGDYIAVYGGDGELIGTYDGGELAGKTLFIRGNTFSVILSTDSSVTGYGFKVTDVSPCPEEDLYEITYVTDTEEYTKIYYKDEPAELDEPYYYFKDGVFCGWATEKGGAVVYDGGVELPAGIGDITLYACTCKTMLDKDEIFYFSNSSRYFDVDGNDCYYMTDENYRMMQLNLYKNYGLGPIPGPIVSIVLTQYPGWDFRGSCYGMSTVTALQHFGYIDVLSLQDAECMNDMVPDEELISFINYYQAQAASSYLCENVAVSPGSLGYRQSLKSLYETVSGGNIAMFTFYTGAPFVTVGHTVLFTGAYTNAAGEHVFIPYDCNHPYWFPSYDKEDCFVVSPDYSSIVYEDEELGAINWTDDFTHFKSFDINGKGSPLEWYKEFFRHIIEAFRNFFKMFTLIGK